MSWGRIDDRMPEHPKWSALERQTDARTWANALAVWTCVLCYANRNETDGEIEAHVLARLTPLGRDALKAADAMVEARLMTRTEHGYALANFTEYNPSRAKKEAEREADRSRKSAGGKASVASRRQPESGKLPGGIRPESDRIPEHPARPGPTRGGEEPPPPPIEPEPVTFRDEIATRWARSYELARGYIPAKADDTATRELATAIEANVAKRGGDRIALLEAILAAYWRDEWPRVHANRASVRNLLGQFDRLLALVADPPKPAEPPKPLTPEEAVAAARARAEAHNRKLRGVA